MSSDSNSIDLVRTKGGWNSFFLAGVTAIPVYIVSYAYADATMERHDEQVALIFTIYFLACLYTGRYISQLWINRNEVVSKAVVKITGGIVVISAVLVFILAQITAGFNMMFLKILFIGLPFTAMSLSLGVLVKLIRTSIKNQLLTANAAAAQSQGELRFLQNQLSPHFLFNTLNNMYGISLTQHEKVPGLLLKLSDLLRYSVYDAKELFVPLKNEVAYIKDYIDFEKIRIGDKLQLEVSMEEGNDSTIKIAPLLLIVFIENAFKHSKNTTEQKIYISISLKIWANSILFAVKNSYSGNSNESSLIKKDSGFGLENVQKRLELLYAGAYDLKTEEKDGYYHVMLQLKGK